TEARMHILEEALRVYPDEVTLQQQLGQLRELTQSVAECASKAQDLEEGREYADAIATWEQIKALDPHFPQAETSLERLRGLQHQELAARKATLVGQLQKE